MWLAAEYVCTADVLSRRIRAFCTATVGQSKRRTQNCYTAISQSWALVRVTVRPPHVKLKWQKFVFISCLVLCVINTVNQGKPSTLIVRTRQLSQQHTLITAVVLLTLYRKCERALLPEIRRLKSKDGHNLSAIIASCVVSSTVTVTAKSSDRFRSRSRQSWRCYHRNCGISRAICCCGATR